MNKLLISFSGGRTSGYMTKRLLNEYAHKYDARVVFANTGLENEATLEFIHQCDIVFGFNTVWVEAVTCPGKGNGIVHRVVTYETASREGEPFEAMIAKYGIPNTSWPQCTRSLKRYAIEHYIRSIGWKSRSYETAIGIRTDERRRVRDDSAIRTVYPLVHWFPADKQDVLDWWCEQPFDLRLEEHQGNCKTCWKKSFSKLIRLHNENPRQFDFFERMEAQYPRVGAEFAKYADAPDRVFFRGRVSTIMLRQMAAAAKDNLRPIAAADLERDGGCSESCELYDTEVVGDLFL